MIIEKGKLTIHFGALADPLAHQLSKQGLSSPLVAEHQRDADAISRVYARGLLNDAEAERARKRLFRSIKDTSSQASREKN